ncbi:hypothetical protein [Pseudomonas putida]
MHSSSTFNRAKKCLPPVILLSAIAGCTSPKVMLHTVAADSPPNSYASFLAPGSWVTIGTPESDAKPNTYTTQTWVPTASDKNAPTAIKAAVSSRASGPLLAIEPRDEWYATTKLNYTYLDNSKQFKTIGIAFQDNAATYVQAIGGLITAAIPFASRISSFPLESSLPTGESSKQKSALTLELPIVVDAADEKKWEGPIPTTSKSTTSGKWTYSIVLSTEQKQRRTMGATDICTLFGALIDCELSTLMSQKNASKWLTYVPVSRCLDATLTIKGAGSQGASAQLTFPIKIADPRYVDLVPLPEKGTITLHSICGADLAVDSSSSEATRAMATVQEIFTQAQKIKAAREAEAAETN